MGITASLVTADIIQLSISDLIAKSLSEENTCMKHFPHFIRFFSNRQLGIGLSPQYDLTHMAGLKQRGESTTPEHNTRRQTFTH